MSPNARNFIDSILTSSLVEGAAALSHGGWLASKEAALQDPNNPFQGRGENRVRVRDLSDAELADLGIQRTESNGGSDVYHHLFMPFEELNTDTKGKNVQPLAALCYALGDFILNGDATVKDLVEVLESIIDGSNQDAIDTIVRVNHACFQAAEIRIGARGFGDTARDDFPLYCSLSSDVAELDAWTTVPAAKWLLEQAQNSLESN